MFNLPGQDYFFHCLSKGRKSMQRAGILLMANNLPKKKLSERKFSLPLRKIFYRHLLLFSYLPWTGTLSFWEGAGLLHTK